MKLKEATLEREKITISKKHLITDIIETLDNDFQNLDIESVESLISVMLGFEKNWLIFNAYITGELKQ
jgi:hypothetical protein